MAEIAVWVDSYDRRATLERRIVDVGLTTAGYLVVESLYEDYGTTPHSGPRRWPDGERSPGVLTVSLIHRPEGLDYDTWIERWHGTQSPLSGELQPRCRYVRNEVVRALTTVLRWSTGSSKRRGRARSTSRIPCCSSTRRAIPRVLSEHITAMLDSVNACLDLDRIRNVTMSEYLFKSR